LKEVIDEEHTGPIPSEIQFLGRACSAMEGERAFPSRILPQENHQLEVLRLLEEEAHQGGTFHLPGRSAEIQGCPNLSSFKASLSEDWRQVQHRN
jgi:hypothetical protein